MWALAWNESHVFEDNFYNSTEPTIHWYEYTKGKGVKQAITVKRPPDVQSYTAILVSYKQRCLPNYI